MQNGLWWLILGCLIGTGFALPGSLYAGALIWLVAFLLALSYRAPERIRYYDLLLFGIACYSFSCFWFVEVLAHFLGIPWIGAFPIALLVALFCSLQFVFIHFLFLRLNISFLERYRLALPLAWLTAEVLFPALFPWSLAATQMVFTPFVQIADIGGAPFVSFMVIWLASLAAEVVASFSKRDRLIRSVVVGLSVTALVIFYGYSKISYWEEQIASAEKIDLAVLQPNWDPDSDFAIERVGERLKEQRQLSLAGMESSYPDILIWPETSVPYDYFTNERVIGMNTKRDPFPELPLPMIFGGQSRIPSVSTDGKSHYLNTAFAVDDHRRIVDRYYKQQLFPFSEVVPLQRYFPSLHKLTGLSTMLVPGEDQQPLVVSVMREGELELISIATAICYEDMTGGVFADLLAQQRTDSNQTADFILALTNDSWFLETIAPRQHHLLAAPRAIENRRFFVRAAGDAMTAIIDPLGRTVEQLTPFKPGVLRSNAVALLVGRTIYVNYGHMILLLLSSLIVMFSLAVTGRRLLKAT